VKPGLILTEKSKEDLIGIILEKEQIIAEKEKRIQELERKLREKEQAEARRRELKMMRLASRVKRARKPGQKPGHVGLTRPCPEKIDRVVEQTLEACPDCHHPLSPSQEILEHIQEDIIPARVEVTLFKRHRYYCSNCQKLVTAPYAPEEIPQIFEIASRVAMLHNGVILEVATPEEFQHSTNPAIQQFIAGQLEGPLQPT